MTDTKISLPMSSATCQPPAKDVWEYNKNTKRVGKVFAVIFFTSIFCLSAFVALMAPFYPPLAVGRGVNKPTIGAIFSCYQLASLISATGVARLMSRIGNKFLFVSGLLVTGACSLLFGFLERCPPGAPFIGLSFAIRSIEGVGSTAVNVAGFAVVAGAFPERIGFLSGLSTAILSMGFTAGPAVGGALYQIGGFGVPFWSFGILLLLVGIFTFFLPDIVCDNENLDTNKDKQIVSYWTLLSEPMVVILLSFMFADCLYATFFDVALSIYLKEEFHLDAGGVSIVFLLESLCFGCFGLIFGRLGDLRIARSPFLIIGFFLVGGSLFFVGPVPSIPLTKTLWLTVGSLLLGSCTIAVMVLAFPTIVKFIEKQGLGTSGELDGLLSGLRFTSITAGGLVGPVLGGVLSERLGFPSASAVISIFMFLPPISLGFYLIWIHCQRKRKHAPDRQIGENAPLIK